jgi:hypothetical protein
VLPVTLALVDAAGPDDFLDLVRGGLTVAMEALPPGSLFGLIGISDCITLVDLSGQRMQQGPGWSCIAVCADLLSMVDFVCCMPCNSSRLNSKSADSNLAPAVLLHATRMGGHALATRCWCCHAFVWVRWHVLLTVSCRSVRSCPAAPACA